MEPTHAIDADHFRAAIFDLDGVVTRTAEVHAAAWKRMFDGFLIRRGRGEAGFDRVEDYRRYIDGKPRYQGVRSFLDARGITLPLGSPDDPPGVETVCGLGNEKNRLYLKLLKETGVRVYDSTLLLIRALRRQGTRVGVVSSSENCTEVLEAAGIRGLFDVQVDGLVSGRLGLEGKPEPDIFVHAVRELGFEPARGVVFEDSLAGVAAGRRGRFGLVVGVDRAGQAEDLRRSGADWVVADLSEITIRSAGSTRGRAHPE